jgi:hypothetical protein
MADVHAPPEQLDLQMQTATLSTYDQVASKVFFLNKLEIKEEFGFRP